MRTLIFTLSLLGIMVAPAFSEVPQTLKKDWPDTDFTQSSIELSSILSGGPPKDGIPSIDQPTFIPVSDSDLSESEPVIGLVVNKVARAYPLRILTWHEIVNDEIGGVPVIVTYCPLCNSAVVYDRRFKGAKGAPTFGTSGLLRNSNLVMYDRGSQTWWQQFTGDAIVGRFNQTKLKTLPSRLESFANFKKRFPKGAVLIPNDPAARPYGRNPYAGYDTAVKPFLYRGDLPKNIPPMSRVVVVGDTAYELRFIREQEVLTDGDVRLTYEGDHASALDAGRIVDSRPVPGVSVRKRNAQGIWDEAPYDVTFAFVFHAFKPHGKWRLAP